MVVLLLVAGVMWGRMVLKAEPRRASANASLTSKVTNSGELPALDLGQRKATVYLELSDKTGRDVFSMNFRDFTQIEPTNVIPPPNPTVEKSDEARRAELFSKLKAVKLQSTIMRDNPAALINDRLFQVGSEPVPGFTITRITPLSVFLKTAGVEEEIELRMYRN